MVIDTLQPAHEVFTSVEWCGAEGYSYAGIQRSPREGIALDAEVFGGTRPALFAQLVSDIYRWAYCRMPVSDRWPDQVSPTPAVAFNHPAATSTELSIEMCFSSGDVLAVAEGLRHLCPAGTYTAAAAGARPLVSGDQIRLWIPEEQVNAQASFHRAEAGLGVRRARAGSLHRFYFAAAPALARPLLDQILAHARARHLPCLAKCVHPTWHGGRSDAVVLYTQRNHVAVVRTILEDLQNEGSLDACAGRPPLFTLPIGHGIGFAEDPVSGESFGMQRATMLAEVIVSNPDDKVEAKLDALASAFRAVGLDPERPHRNSRQHDRCEGPENWDSTL